MLILTRKLGESITIGDDIKVSVLGIRGRQVRLGIDAPESVVVHREEIYVKIQAENRKASEPVKGDLFGMVKLIKDKITGTPPDVLDRVVDFKDKPATKPNGNRRGDTDSSHSK